jgi:hypothetical protein
MRSAISAGLFLSTIKYMLMFENLVFRFGRHADTDSTALVSHGRSLAARRVCADLPALQLRLTREERR